MILNEQTGPIIACSTGSVGNSAVAIIRISGHNYLHLINHLFSINLELIKTRYAYFCSFIGHNGNILDEIVLTFFKSPHSYNGEDILELGVHGNQINIERIISEVLKVKLFERAKPGEFTLRALHNGKLSLNQVEGLDLLLNANNIFSLNQGFSLLSGKLKESFLGLHTCYLKHRSAIEFGFDFLDDIGEEQFYIQLNSSFNDLRLSISQLYSHVSNSNFSLLKPDIVLCGQPNAGKSTLFNLLLNSDRAITSEIAGTTRDYIKEDIRLGENIYSLIDTAGIRTTEDNDFGKIEASGIEKALKLVEGAFYRILVINPFEFSEEYLFKLTGLDFDDIIITHADRQGFDKALEALYISLRAALDINSEGKFSGPIEPRNAGPIEPRNAGPIEPRNTGPIEPRNTGPIEPRNTGPIEPKITNLKGNGSEILQYMHQRIDSKFMKSLDFDPILIQRHAESIKDIYKSFLEYEDIFLSEDDMALLASELNSLGYCISELIGIVNVDDVLRNIFNNFCIGK